MPNVTSSRALVSSAGIGGLAAAKAVALHFEIVVGCDRDALPNGRGLKSKAE